MVVYTKLVEKVPARSERPPQDERQQQADERSTRPSSKPEWYQRLVDDSRQRLREQDAAMKPGLHEGVLP